MIALVSVDLDVPHLDHPFEYLIPEELEVHVGSRVAVNFAGRRHYGWVTGIQKNSASGRKLQEIKRVVGPYPLVTEGVIRTAQYLSARYATNLKQILAFAIPTRRASVEKEFEANPSPDERIGTDSKATKTSQPLRAVSTVYPGQMLTSIENAVGTGEEHGIAIVVVPTSLSARRVKKHLQLVLPNLRIALADTEQSDAERYRVHLRALTGCVDVVVGTRSVVWTPIVGCGSIIIWDDGDDRLKERRSPRLDALDIAVARSHVEHVNLLCASYARSVKAQMLVSSGWAQDTSPSRTSALTLIPRTRVFDWADAEKEGVSGYSRLPDGAYRVIREGLENRRPVLVQVAAAGQITELECPVCHLSREAEAGECPHPSHDWGRKLRIGSDRIRDELERAFPNVPVLVSSSTAGIRDRVEATPAIVVATTSSEPLAPDGYGAVVISEAESVAYTDSLDAQLEAERRWMGALALARPGAPAMIVGTIPEVLEQAVVRWQSEVLAQQELETRAELGFPPTRWLVSISARQDAIKETSAAIRQTAAEVQDEIVERPYAPIAIVSVSPPYIDNDGSQLQTLITSCEPRFTNTLMTTLRQVQVQRSKNGQSLLVIEVNPQQISHH